MLIRPATLRDIPRVVRLLETMEKEAMVYTLGVTRYKLIESLSYLGGKGYVAEENGNIVACIFMEEVIPDTVMIYDLAVDRAYRGRGLATDLVRLVMSDCCRHHIDNIGAKVAGKNQNGLRFWKKFGQEVDSCSMFVEFEIKLEG